MKKLIITLLILIAAVTTTTADEQDTLWYRQTGDVEELDFTPDDNYVIAWTNGIEFWEVNEGVKEFFIISEATGDFNFNEEYLVFAQDSTPKLLDWETREVVEGFEKEKENLGRIRTAKSRNEFMANTYHHDEVFSDIIGNMIYFYNIDTKMKVDSISFIKQFEKDNYKWKRTIHEYDYAGNNDELIYVIIDDVNDEIENIPPSERKRIYYVKFYDRETKELVDSVYSFTNTNKQFGGFNKMQVMNDRSKIAWNHRGGEVNFYDINNKRFYDKLVFDDRDFVNTDDISYSNDGKYLGITNNAPCCRYLKIFNSFDKKIVLDFNSGGWSWKKFSISRNQSKVIVSPGSSLVMYNSNFIETGFDFGTNNSTNIMKSEYSNNILNISIENIVDKNSSLSLIDSNGKVIYDSIDYPFGYKVDYKLNLANLPKGLYFLKLGVIDSVITNKIIKE